jgi:hypothetical protein
MRRLALAPVIVGPVAAAATLLWVSGYLWPIGTTFARCFMREPTPDDEADVFA